MTLPFSTQHVSCPLFKIQRHPCKEMIEMKNEHFYAVWLNSTNEERVACCKVIRKYIVIILIMNLINASVIISVQTSEKPRSSEPPIFLLARAHQPSPWPRQCWCIPLGRKHWEHLHLLLQPKQGHRQQAHHQCGQDQAKAGSSYGGRCSSYSSR